MGISYDMVRVPDHRRMAMKNRAACQFRTPATFPKERDRNPMEIDAYAKSHSATILHIRHPQPLQDPTWNYVVLGAAAFFEGISFAIAFRQFKRLAGSTPFWEFVRRSKDPTTYTVLAEDAAALVGLAIAAVGIALSHWLQLSALDDAASVLIGILLAGVASLLAWQSPGLLIGEGIRPETARALRDIALAQPGVRDVGRVLSMYVGPDDVIGRQSLQR